MIAIILPTRGLVFTQVEEGIEKIRKDFDLKVYRSYDKTIPEAQNFLTEKAYEEGAEYFLFIEEDIIPRTGLVKEMLFHDISFVDYGVNGWSCSAKENGEILWCGLGFTMVKRVVLDFLEKPWFRTDKTYRLNDRKWIDRKMKYGGHDIYFFSRVREKGFRIEQIKGECEHLKLESLGVPENNGGLHRIGMKSKIINYQKI